MVTFCGNIYGPLDGETLCHNLAAERFHIKKICSRLYSIEIEFYYKNTKKLFLSHPLGDLGVKYALRL